MSEFGFRQECVILDADCTINLASSGVFSDVLAILLPCRCAITQHVLRQEVLRNDDDLQLCIDSGLLQIVKPQGEEYTTILQINDDINVQYKVLGDGEIETCSIAWHRNWLVGIDDKKARRYFAREYPSIQLMTTPELMKYWVQAAAPVPSKVKQALQCIRTVGRYQISNRHELFEWWHSWL